MIRAFGGHTPDTQRAAFIAENAQVIGDVTLSEDSSVWYGAVLRGDESAVTVGRGSNIQDNAVLHGDEGYDVRIGENVTVGHCAVVHGCTVGNNVIVGMHATLLNGCVIGDGSIIGAGALVREGQIVEKGSLVVGVPGKAVRELTQENAAYIASNAAVYVDLARAYADAPQMP